jgi:hypothetical protein
MVLFKYVRGGDTVSSNGEFANPTRIVIESDAVTMDQLMEDFKIFALSLGYHPDTVNKVQMVDEEEESEDEESDFMKDLKGIDDGY